VNNGGLAMPVKTIKIQVGLKDSASSSQPVKSTPNNTCVFFAYVFLYSFSNVHENT
jgi:hypothetical protein